MNNNKRVRKTAILALALASILLTTGAGQAMAYDDARDGHFGAHLVIDLFERIGTFVGDLAAEVVEVFTKAGSQPTQDG